MVTPESAFCFPACRFALEPPARVNPPVPITIVGITTVSSPVFSVSAEVGFLLASGSLTDTVIASAGAQSPPASNVIDASLYVIIISTLLPP